MCIHCKDRASKAKGTQTEKCTVLLALMLVQGTNIRGTKLLSACEPGCTDTCAMTLRARSWLDNSLRRFTYNPPYECKYALQYNS